MEKNEKLLGAITNEKTMMFLVLGIVSVVAGFCVMCTLVTVAVQKTNEIGVLKSCGAGAWRIARLFLFQGFVVGIIGVTVGVVLGGLTVHYIDEIRTALSWVMGRDVFPKEIYNLDKLPTCLTLHDVLIIVSCAQVFATLAGAVPAIWAAWLEPVEALRHE